MGDWVERAACRGHGELFFPTRGENDVAIQAKRLCARCPVFEDCKAFVKKHPTMIGIWAGTTEKARRRWRV